MASTRSATVPGGVKLSLYHVSASYPEFTLVRTWQHASEMTAEVVVMLFQSCGIGSIRGPRHAVHSNLLIDFPEPRFKADARKDILAVSLATAARAAFALSRSSFFGQVHDPKALPVQR